MKNSLPSGRAVRPSPGLVRGPLPGLFVPAALLMGRWGPNCWECMSWGSPAEVIPIHKIQSSLSSLIYFLDGFLVCDLQFHWEFPKVGKSPLEALAILQQILPIIAGYSEYCYSMTGVFFGSWWSSFGTATHLKCMSFRFWIYFLSNWNQNAFWDGLLIPLRKHLD